MVEGGSRMGERLAGLDMIWHVKIATHEAVKQKIPISIGFSSEAVKAEH